VHWRHSEILMHMFLKSGTMFLIILLVGACSAVEKTVGENGRLKHNQLQDEILKAMDESGVLNEWKDKLDDLLYKDNDINVDEAIKKMGEEKKSVISTEQRKMVSDFVEEYVTDKSLKVDTDLIMSIVERVQKSPKLNLAQIFVQLGPVIDVISAIGQKTKDIKKIVDRQAPVFDSPAKTKDVLHTLAENLKSELVRLTLDTPPTKTKKSPPPQKKEKKQPTKNAGFGGLDLADYLTLGSSLLKGGNAGQMMDLLSGKADIASMFSLLPSLIENGNYKDLLNKVLGSYLEGTPYGPMIQQYAGSMLESEQGQAVIEGLYSTLEKFVKSESGRRLTTVLPKLFAAKDMESMLEIVGSEAEWNWSMFFNNIENSDYKENFMDTLSEYIVIAYEFVTNPPKDSMLSKAPILINGFLISNRIPAFDSKKPVESLTKIVNKCIRLFTTWKLDVTPYAKVIKDAVSQAIKTQAGDNSLSSLKFHEKKSLISRMLDTELMTPVQTVWSVYRHVSADKKQAKCASHLLCQINKRERENLTRQAVTKGASLAVAWALSKGDKDKYWVLYKSVWEGSKGDDCMSNYPVKGDNCQVFSWQKNQFMNTEYDHVEL